ncbi:wHTH domain-containing protein [Saccharothrix sp. Mg75]|uniref:wHTH domain-containing protein n=1 Tax=Saccharothrix sp. Mg75 TaxID=3445357 RepID=UPI003EEC919D
MAITGGGDDTRNDISGTVNAPVVQANKIDTVNNNYYGSRPPEPASPADPWVDLAVRAEAWAHVKAERDTADLRDRIAFVAGGLGEVRRRAVDVLGDDPWLDTSQAERFAKRIGWLLKQKLGTTSLLLDPAEAALLAVVPLLNDTLWCAAAAKLSAIDPVDLARHRAEGDRADYQDHLAENSRLVDRALLPALPDRPNARREIGWWLFNRWVRQRAELVKPRAVGALLAEVGVVEAGLGEVLSTDRVRELLHGLRLEPQALCGTDRLNRITHQDTLYGGEPDEEHVRVPLLGLLLAVAHTTSVPITDLSDTIPWHLGIPAPVDVDRLHRAVAKAVWVPEADNLVLKADCQHGAVIEALREHTVRVDSLLDAVRRAAEVHSTLTVLGQLPARASASGVDAARDADGRPEFSGWSRFSLDDDRVRELLMGEQLYRDRNLAVRELYQNALDACRYRRAREQYLHRTACRATTWEGRILFTQGVEENGRAYLECADNGIGMGEPELKGVFARAGARFADLAEFRDEQADWNSLDPPVELFPNSRFGIGVLSYFMLADEITVTTCRAARTGGRPGRTLRATISGPGHLFQIQPVADRAEPGTTIRLYLRNAGRTSCVQVLRQVLGIAEFDTVASHDAEHERWEPGVFKGRRRQPWEQHGINAHGILIPAVGGQVVWCEWGGALLVDGLLAHPDLRHGVLAGPDDDSPFTGCVVNLTGKAAPRLSVDRTKVVDDVAAAVEDLLVRGVDEMTDSATPMPTLQWMSEVGWWIPRLADIASSREPRTSHPRAERRGWAVPREAVSFPQDLHVVLDPDRRSVQGVTPPDRLLEVVPFTRLADHVYLWRLLVNSPNAALSGLLEIVPELIEVDRLLRARPSDLAVVSHIFESARSWRSADERLSPHDIVTIAQRTGSTPREVAHRASALGFTDLVVERFSAESVPDRVDLGLLFNSVGEVCAYDEHSGVASPGQVLNGLFGLGLSLEEIARRLQHHGFDLTVLDLLPSSPKREDVHLVSSYCSGVRPWLALGSSIPFVHLWWVADKLGMHVDEVGRRLAQYGFEVESSSNGAHFDHRYDPVVLSNGIAGSPPWLDRSVPVPPGHVVKAASVTGTPVAAVAERLTTHGFRCPERLVARPVKEDEVLLSSDVDGVAPWLTTDEPIKPHHIARYLRLSVSPDDNVVARLVEYGFDVDTTHLPARFSAQDVVLLSSSLNGADTWLRGEEPVPLVHLVEAAATLSTTITEVADRLRELGMNSPDPAVTIRNAMARVPLA